MAAHSTHVFFQILDRKFASAALALIALAGLLLFTMVPKGASQGSPQALSDFGFWEIECADCQGYFTRMSDRSIRLDGSAHPHIAYGGNHLYYAYHDGSQWRYEVVDPNPGVGWHASLALDGGDYPHIRYVDRLGFTGSDGSLALDGNGNPHISYHAGLSSYQLRYASFTPAAGIIFLPFASRP